MGVLAVSFSAFRLLRHGGYFYLALISLGFMAAAVVMASLFGGRQPATVALDVGISVLRFGIPVFVTFMVQGLIANEFERKYFLSSLTYPHSRMVWLIGRYITILVLIAIVLLIHALVLRELVDFVGGGYQQATRYALDAKYWLVIAFAFVDMVVVASFGVLISIFARSPGFVVFGTMGFLLIARSYSSIYALLDGASGLVANEKTYREGLGLLYLLIPDLGALDVRSIALYGQLNFLPAIWPQHLAGAGLYATASISLAVWLLHRRRFD